MASEATAQEHAARMAIAQIRRDGGTQLREKIDLATVTEYAESMAEGAVLPPVVVFQDEAGVCWLADGFHRVAAAEISGQADVAAEFRQGSRREAILYAAGTNGRHGLRRTNADKRRAVLALLEDPEWRQFSDGEIGRRCAVSQPFVSSLRAEVAATQNGYESTERIGADGRRINVSNIGRPAAGKAADPGEPTADPVAEKPAEAPIQEKAAGKMAIHSSSKSAEHYTPAEVIQAVLECFGSIDLDPCSNSKANPNVPATMHYTAKDNGLLQPWAGRVFMNPPYGAEIGQWIERLAVEFEAGNVTEAIALVPARPGSLWFAELSKAAALWCFVAGRLTFVNNDNPAHFPSALAYLGPRPRAFAAAFAGLGSLWREVPAAEVVDPAPKADLLAAQDAKPAGLTGQDLAAWILKDKLSQRQAAELLGIGQASVSVWARRTDELLPAELNNKLARVLAEQTSRQE